jgi:hypothetical protein
MSTPRITLPPPFSRAARTAAAVIAAIGWLALAMQLVVTLGMMTADGHSVPAAVWRYLGYFTILTNLLVAVTMTRVARDRWPAGAAPQVSVVSGVVLAIAIVGVVYEVLLSGRVPAMGPLWWTADRLLHYVVPTLAVLWWLACVPKHTLGARDPVRWLAYPAGYLVYALARGAVDQWYPYFFIDVAAIGYGQALTNAALLSVGMLAVGYVIVGLVALTRTSRTS